MEIIHYTSDDFVMTVDCYRTDQLFARASRKIKTIEKATQYNVTGPSGKLFVRNPVKKSTIELEPGSITHPLFFENADYIFDMEFKDAAVSNARVYSRLNEITEKFSRKQRDRIQTLTGTINYGNNIGKYDFVVRYEKDGIGKEFCFSFEVFPTKLDYKSDYQTIIRDIEKEYTYLVLDLLKKTYSNFKSETSNNNDLIWWSVFGTVYKEMLQAARVILNKPHSRLVRFEEYCKRNQLRKLVPALEERLAMFKEFPHKLYKTSNKRLTADTTENRFFKHVMKEVQRKFSRIKAFIDIREADGGYDISDEFREELSEIENALMRINYHPFFKGVRDFKGLTQESLVLQRKAGYSAVYRNWILLKRGLDLFEGIQKIDLKNIADLYQIWCFLKMKGMIQFILNGKNPSEMDLLKVQVDNFLFTLEKGKTSKVVFENETGDNIELYHDYTFPYNSNTENLSYTVEQRPDIVLKVTKSDLEDSYVFTYLYDAKYRLQSDEKGDEPDYPPEDAINQMHRYRDAIYYLNKETSIKGKEVIGGYILFPGSGSAAQVEKHNFYTSIKNVNIGAFPLVPNDRYESQKLFENHLREIIISNSENVLQDVIPQKGMYFEDSDALVLAGFLKSDEQKKYFKNGQATVYHIPVYSKNTGKLNCIRNLRKLKYFCPIINGIEEYYTIDDIKVLARKDVFPVGHSSGLHENSEASYYVFTLSNMRRLSKKINTTQGGHPLFRYCKLSELRCVNTINEFKKIAQEEKVG
jgi:predicted component of viral defense system (DUF524 family)